VRGGGGLLRERLIQLKYLFFLNSSIETGIIALIYFMVHCLGIWLE